MQATINSSLIETYLFATRQSTHKSTYDIEGHHLLNIPLLNINYPYLGKMCGH